MVSDINHGFDNKQGVINWEEHVGLCNIAAKRMCEITPQLKPHYEDIIEDLKFKLWYCARPLENGKGFDPDRGIRFSTYAVVSMLRSHREIKKLYLDMPESAARGKGVRKVSINAKYANADSTLESIIPGKPGPDINERLDHQDVCERIFGICTQKEREYLSVFVEPGVNEKLASQTLNLDRNTGPHRRKRASKRVRALCERYPELFEGYTHITRRDRA